MIAEGRMPLDNITVAEYLQLAVIHAMDNKLTHIDHGIVYGGQKYQLHFCMKNMGPSHSLDAALTEEQ